MTESKTLDDNRVRQIAQPIGKAVHDNYAAGPESPERALESLNALAWVAGAIIAGAPEADRDKARGFFVDALDGTIRMILAGGGLNEGAAGEGRN